MITSWVRRSMFMDEIRVGVVGAGTNTVAKHIPKLQAIPGVMIVSVCNRSRDSSARVAEQFGIPTIYNDWQKAAERYFITWCLQFCARRGQNCKHKNVKYLAAAGEIGSIDVAVIDESSWNNYG